jgi:hypothetical protein
MFLHLEVWSVLLEIDMWHFQYKYIATCMICFFLGPIYLEAELKLNVYCGGALFESQPGIGYND